MSYLDELQDMVGSPEGTAPEKQRLALVTTFQEILSMALWVMYNHYNTVEHVRASSNDTLKQKGCGFVSRVDLGATSTITVPSSHLYTVYLYHCRKHKSPPFSRQELIKHLDGHRCRVVPGAGLSSKLKDPKRLFGPKASSSMHTQLRMIRFHIADLAKTLEVKVDELIPGHILKLLRDEYPYITVEPPRRKP